ncbi:cytochrome P450 6j1-like [Colletes latitarsis]|uniref:cytochrome P450 6j1-like n=1 Tax=Colletes latitarsis TaxID=2605962 RepID=UPI0040373308
MVCPLFVGALALVVVYLVNKYSYWKKRGIPVARGLLPCVGHMLPVFVLKMSGSEMARQMYNDARNSSMVGFYKLTTLGLLIREPRLVKTVLQSNFSSFHANQSSIQADVDPLVAKDPTFNYGDVWANGRKRLAFAFSGARLKMLFVAVCGVCKKFEDYLERRLKSNAKHEVELKSLFSRFTGEVVANAGFGIEGYCLEDEPNLESFDLIGKSILEPTLIHALANIIIFFIPMLNRVLKISFIPTRVDKLVRRIVTENLELRRKSSTTRNDFLQTMIEMQKSEGGKLDEELIAADQLSFFLNGYETSSITLSFVGFQLAVHQDVQRRLRDEVLSTIARHGGTVTFDALKEMTYMDRVINESQRLYPAVGTLIKVCTEEFVLEGSDGLRCRVVPGTKVVVSIHGLHMDPEYWANPEVFDPERFSNERKQSIEKMTFIPFSEGPRMCAGMVMALLQMKACLATLLRSYKLELSSKTRLPLKLSPSHFFSSPIGGLWVHVSKI